MRIPSRNLYFLLCYAWNRLESRSLVDVPATSLDLPQDLFAHLLLEGFEKLIKRGLDRDYQERSEDTRRPRGKIDFSRTARRALRLRGQIHVRYEELSRNVLHNRIVKTTMSRLATDPDLDSGLRGNLERMARRIPDVIEVELRDELFDQVQIHRNNAGYGFLLDLCRLVNHSLVPEGRSGKFRFPEFTGDDAEMGRLFEDFVRNFLRIERPTLRVLGGHKQIVWDATSEVGSVRFPVMKADVLVPSVSGQSAIIETKCTSKPFPKNLGGNPTLNSDHLYQLFAYLKNYPRELGQGQLPALGVLLYGTVGGGWCSHRYRVHEHPLWVRTLDLAMPWTEVRAALLDLALELEQCTSAPAPAGT